MGRGSPGTQNPQPDYFVGATIAANAISLQRGNDATAVRTNTGIVTITLGGGGVAIDSSAGTGVALAQVELDYDGAAGLTCQAHWASATSLVLNFTAGSNGAAADPTRFSCSISRRIAA